MEKDIRTHQLRIEEQLDSLSRNPARAEKVYAYHVERIRDFQHERLIHLLVTFFFSALLLFFITALVVIGSFNVAETQLLVILLASIVLLLFITVLFYIRHYYQLENGVQRLYKLSDQLQVIIAR